MMDWTRFMLAAALCLCALAGPGTVRAQIAPAAAEELMQLSGLWKQLGALVEQVQGGMDQGIAHAEAQGAPAMPEATRQRLFEAAGRAFAGDRLRSTAQAVLVEGTPAADLPALRDWYTGTIGRRITALEEAASGGDPQAQLQAGVAVFQAASKERQALLSELVRVTQAPQAMSNMTINMMLSIHEGVTRARPEQPGPSPAELRAQLEGQRMQMLQNMTGVSLALFAKTYDSLDDEALSRYVAFLDGPTGQRWNALGISAVETAMLRGAREWGQDMPAAHESSRT